MAWAKVTQDSVDYAQKDGEGKLYTQDHCQEIVNNADAAIDVADNVIASYNAAITDLNTNKTHHNGVKTDFEAALAVFE